MKKALLFLLPFLIIAAVVHAQTETDAGHGNT